MGLPELTVNQELLKCSDCKKTFHVRCAIKRGLITSIDVMTKYQTDADGQIQIFCSTHTKIKRDLPEVDDMLSVNTNAMSTITGFTGLESNAGPTSVTNFNQTIDVDFPLNRSLTQNEISASKNADGLSLNSNVHYFGS